jgi:hypothetical protein
MVFTYLPDNPLARMAVRWMAGEFQVGERMEYEGYSDGAPEVMVAWKKKRVDVYKHREEIEDEVLRGEHRDEEE